MIKKIKTIKEVHYCDDCKKELEEYNNGCFSSYKCECCRNEVCYDCSKSIGIEYDYYYFCKTCYPIMDKLYNKIVKAKKNFEDKMKAMYELMKEI